MMSTLRTHLCGVGGPLEVSRHKQVDDRSADALRGQDERQWPPEAEHLFDCCVALQKQMSNLFILILHVV